MSTQEYLCDYGHFFDEPRSYSETELAAGSVRSETFVECPVCGSSGFEDFSTSWGISVLKGLWDGARKVEGSVTQGDWPNLITDIIQQLHDVEVG